ncbi:hypothetical protein SCHPADRAFT_1001797 [Schizopora paradoxa]|uniref:F-box domain-containing protein n=1 Tax=Schizopora paradoxa TaxID=27342 RepID=A0A0H2R7D7_9AGAM|nr:hypothetical protein SCHPADRAFT_1001797 [Schizopora paradoxa]
MTSKTSWRKLNDDGQDVCRSLDYIVDGIQILKEFVQKGQRMDGDGEEKVNLKRIWKFRLFQSSIGSPIDVEGARASLRTMKDARRLLTSLLQSIDDPIVAVTKTAVKDIHGAGLELLPDDVLAIIFEMHVGAYMYETPAYEAYSADKYPSLIISWVCQRFRQIALWLPDLWKHASFTFPEKILLLFKERCSIPALHIRPATKFPGHYARFFGTIHPPHQWRELHLHFDNEDELKDDFKHLSSAVGQNPLEALEYLSIRNDLTVNSDLSEFEERWHAIYLPEDPSAIISSWQMPKLARLKLRNILSPIALRCENVTWFCFEFCDAERPLDFTVLQEQLQLMPNLESLSVTFSINFPFDDSSQFNHSSSTPSLTYLNLKIGSATPGPMVARLMSLVDTQRVTRLELNLRGRYQAKESHFESWVHAIFPETAGAFARVEQFALDVTNLRGSETSFHRIFSSLPNLQDVSLVLPHFSEIYIHDDWINRGAFRRLRYLLIEVIRMPGDPTPIDTGTTSFDAIFESQHCMGFERLEVRNRSYYPITEGKDSLQRILGDKLQWIDCQSSVTSVFDYDYDDF